MSLSRAGKLWIAVMIAFAVFVSVLILLGQLSEAWSDPALTKACILESLLARNDGSCVSMIASQLRSSHIGALGLWLWIDCGFVLVYLLMFLLIAQASASVLLTNRRSVLGWTSIGILALPALLAAASDWTENFRFMSALHALPAADEMSSAARSIAAASLFKWRFFTLALAIAVLLSLLTAYMRFTTKAFRARLAAKVPGWDTIRKFEKNSAFRLSWLWMLVVPLAARVLVFLGKKVAASPELKQWAYLFPQTLPLVMNLLYLCSLCSFLGMLVYLWRCPNPVKDFDDWAEFKAKNSGGPELLRYLREIASLGAVSVRSVVNTVRSMQRDKLISVPEDRRLGELEESSASVNTWLSAASFADSNLGEAYSRTWALARDSRFVSRLVCTLLYVCAFAMLVYLVYRNFRFFLSQWWA